MILQNQHLSPLMIAAGRGDAAEVKDLLESGASLFLLDRITGTSALHFATQSGNVQTAQLLVNAGAFINLQAVSNSFTPLMIAVWYRNPAMVSFLLMQERINPLIKDFFGRTAYDFIDQKDGKILEKADAEIVKIFDDYYEERNSYIQNHFQEDETTPKTNSDINVRIPNGNKGNDNHTAILVAARDGNVGLFKKLLDNGADILATDEYMKANTAHKAAYNGHADILNLLSKHPDFDKIKNEQGPTNGYTPLHDAVWHGHYEAVKILLDADVERNLKAWDDLTPLDLARKNHYYKIIQLLQ